jgi:S1-C subfamily serine protease
MRWFLVHPSGLRYPIGITGLRLGRAADNDVVLADEEVSRHHAVIRWQDDRPWIEDNGSRNGTFVDEVRVTGAQPLHPGQVIRLGRTRLQVEFVAASVPTAAPVPPAPPPAAVSATPSTVGSGLSPVQAALIGALIGLAGLLIVFLAVVWPLLRQAAPAPPATPLAPTVAQARALRATAFLLTPIEDTANSVPATGIVVAERGRLLTAYTAVYDATTGQPYNRKSQVLVGLSSDPTRAETSLDRWYLARVVRADRNRDLAVLQIFALQDGSPLPNSFGLTPVVLGDTAGLRPGAPLVILSFGTDQNRVLALAQAVLTDVIADAELGLARGWLQTDIVLGREHLGGPVLDNQARLVGLYTGATVAGGRTGLVRSLDAAQPLLRGAD